MKKLLPGVIVAFAVGVVLLSVFSVSPSAWCAENARWNGMIHTSQAAELGPDTYGGHMLAPAFFARHMYGPDEGMSNTGSMTAQSAGTYFQCPASESGSWGGGTR